MKTLIRTLGISIICCMLTFPATGAGIQGVIKLTRKVANTINKKEFNMIRNLTDEQFQVIKKKMGVDEVAVREMSEDEINTLQTVSGDSFQVVSKLQTEANMSLDEINFIRKMTDEQQNQLKVLLADDPRY